MNTNACAGECHPCLVSLWEVIPLINTLALYVRVQIRYKRWSKKSLLHFWGESLINLQLCPRSRNPRRSKISQQGHHHFKKLQKKPRKPAWLMYDLELSIFQIENILLSQVPSRITSSHPGPGQPRTWSKDPHPRSDPWQNFKKPSHPPFYSGYLPFLNCPYPTSLSLPFPHFSPSPILHQSSPTLDLIAHPHFFTRRVRRKHRSVILCWISDRSVSTCLLWRKTAKQRFETKSRPWSVPLLTSPWKTPAVMSHQFPLLQVSHSIEEVVGTPCWL